MLSFLVKKAFFDMWDHFIGVIIMNLGFIALLTIPILLPPLAAEIHIVLALLIQVVGVLAVFVYAGVVAAAARDIVNYQGPEFGKVAAYFSESWKSSLIFGLINAAVVLIAVVGFPVYVAMENLLGLAAIIFLFWAIVIWVLSVQFYFPFRAQQPDQKVTKIIRKCFVIFFDNTIFALVVGVGSAAVIAGSVFTALLIPGVTGLLIWHQAALKLRLYKYDYLEQNPDANRRRIPWDALLIDDRERVGKRTLRGMIFPWKE